MKKEARRCKSCRRIVFYIVQEGNILGLPICTTKKVRDWKIAKDASGHTGYYCEDCIRKKNLSA